MYFFLFFVFVVYIAVSVRLCFRQDVYRDILASQQRSIIAQGCEIVLYTVFTTLFMIILYAFFLALSWKKRQTFNGQE